MPDHMGMFAIACMGCEKMVKEFEELNDDYSKIMVQVWACPLCCCCSSGSPCIRSHTIVRQDLAGLVTEHPAGTIPTAMRHVECSICAMRFHRLFTGRKPTLCNAIFISTTNVLSWRLRTFPFATKSKLAISQLTRRECLLCPMCGRLWRPYLRVENETTCDDVPNVVVGFSTLVV